MNEYSNENRVNRANRIKFEQLLAFRCFALAYMTASLVQLHYYNQQFDQNFIFLTIWGAYSVYCYFGLVTIENISYLKNNEIQFFHDNLWKITQLLYTIAFSLEVPIFFMFWGYIFPQILPMDISFLILNINVHAISVIFIVVDFIFNDIKIHRKHFIVLVILAIMYLFVNLGYVLITDKVIYPGITWKNLISYLLGIVTMGLVSGTFWMGVYYTEKYKGTEEISDCKLLGQIE